MEDGFKTIIFAFILLSLFGVLILTSVNEVGTEYGKDTSTVISGSYFNELNDTVSSIEQNAKNLKQRLDEKSVWTQVAGIVLVGIYPIAKDMFSLIFLPFNVVSNLLSDVLHIPLFVTSVLLGLLVIGVIFGLWQLLKVGN